MCGEGDERPATTGNDAWLRQYYTRGKAAAAPPEPAPLLTPQPAEKYDEAQRLGAGGEKEVVQVRDRDTLRDVALARPRDGRSAQAFVREARILARLEHPHIVPVHDLGLAPDGRPYFTMKLLAGETLEAALARLRQGDAATIAKYPLPVLLDIFVRVCEAAAFAHSRGIIHRDIKPANVQIGEYGEVRLIDWGLAKSLGDATDPTDLSDPADLAVVATSAGTVKGTPGYMAPEQAAGHGADADVRTDTYALGALLYALLTWQPPIAGGSTTDVLCKTIAGEIKPPRRRAPDRAIPHALEAIACKALATDPAGRYPTADALLADVHAFTNGYATSAETAGPLRLLWLVVKRHRALSLVIAASLLALATVGVVAVQRIRASRDELREEQTLCTRLTRAAVPKLLVEARAQMRSLAYDEALETLRTAIGVDPAQNEAWDLAGWIYLGQERYALAAAAFRHELQTVATAAGRGLPAHGGPALPGAADAGRGANEETPGREPALLHRRARGATVRNTANDASRADPGLALAERASLLSHDGRCLLAPDEFRKLIEQARAADSRHARDSRTALGVYCSRRNPDSWTNAAHRAFVQWAVRTLNDGHAELDLRPAATGLEARVTGAAANDLLPLAGLPLESLDVRDTAVRDLQPLRGMPLRALDISGAPVATFDPVYGLPLRELDAEGFRKLPADLFARCPALETVTVSAGTELSRQGATWPAAVRVIRK
jgi:tRNA A-37 threonylcarbamoyl transferase component Bud32/tetratricopeptide (TPR) repeat protein